ncbi:glycosyltransferase family 4 protein [Magnetospira sp. QH-2]|uniref:glycosyltransferase family 4 protein n=1 Tax=Magnetospira sp. (strain QH-2) TaxID=1288970 RepID=UPI0003E81B40|nr:glycosyltransferase family 4 protein [Magnetospira sp. QH-2]CCQ75455.1 putative GT4 : distantly related to GDP-Man: a-D-mannose-a-(1,6)-phosphatidyl myo-inositol monomannosyltransferase [Magnetospira sp. QH-2]
MKILFLTENFPPETNAAATRVYERALYWVRWGHEVTIITCAPNFPQGRLYEGWKNKWVQVQDMDGLRVVRVKTYMAANAGFAKRMLDFLSFMVTGFAAGLFQKRPDVISATSPQFFSAVAGWALGKVRRVPFVFELGDIWPASITAVGAMQDNLALRWMEKLELYLYRSSASVAALTEAFKVNLTGRGIDAGKIAVVRNGVDLDRYAPRETDQALAAEWDLTDKFVVGYVGTHGMAHGLSNVLDAAERLKDLPNFRFLLVGAGAEREMLMEAARQRGLNNVVFGPPQPKEAMPRVWSLCHVALVHLRDTPVFAEVIPSKMFEAMGMGLPILMALPRGEASEILEADGAGIWVPPEDPDALAEACRTLADTDFRTKMAARSLASAPLHTREKQAEEMMAVLEASAQGRGSEVGLSR